MTVDKQPATIYITSSLSDYKLPKKDLKDWYSEFRVPALVYFRLIDDSQLFMPYHRQYHGNEVFNHIRALYTKLTKIISGRTFNKYAGYRSTANDLKKV